MNEYQKKCGCGWSWCSPSLCSFCGTDTHLTINSPGSGGCPDVNGKWILFCNAESCKNKATKDFNLYWKKNEHKSTNPRT